MNKISKYGKEIIEAEAQAILSLNDYIDESFSQAVENILNMSKTGHIIVSGMGKAGFIGMKISATLASTGVPSFFLHPAEAIHGDLGRYTKDDLALILSNSGETDEVLKIIPTIKRIGCPIISITASNNSTLAKHSDVTLQIGKQKEAGPLNIAPTTSAIAMLALGDALAMSILNEKNLTAEEYAMYHPGGSLGRSLMLAHEIMRKNEQVCVVDENLSIKEVVKAYSSTSGRPGAAIITNKNKELVGIFTDGDLRRCLDKDIDFINEKVSTIMGSNPKTVNEDTLAVEILRILSENKIDQIIVVNNENLPVGLVDIQDLCFLSR